jgi:hypothetical protein
MMNEILGQLKGGDRSFPSLCSFITLWTFCLPLELEGDDFLAIDSP